MKRLGLVFLSCEDVYGERPDLACFARPSPDGSRMLRLQIVDGTGRDRMGVLLFSE